MNIVSGCITSYLRCDKPETDRNMRRYCAFMGERLLSVYLQTNEKKVQSVKMKYNKWWPPFVRKIRANLGINRNTKIYKELRDRLGYKSSYQVRKDI